MMDDPIKTHILRMTNYSGHHADNGDLFESWEFSFDGQDRVEVFAQWLHLASYRTIDYISGPQEYVDYIAKVLIDGGFEIIVRDSKHAIVFPRESESESINWQEFHKWNNDPVVKEIGEKLGSGAYHKKCERCGGTGKWVMFNKTVDCECQR